MRFLSFRFVSVVILLIIGLIHFFFGEILFLFSGFGEVIYAGWAHDFKSLVIEDGICFYHIQRIIPSAVVHYGLLLFKMPLDSEYFVQGYLVSDNVILGFQVYNLIVLCATVWIWSMVLDEIKLKISGKWLGLIGLLLNFALLKEAFYDPVSTDPTALFIGTLLLYCYLASRPISLLIVTAIGAFCWPTVLYVGPILYIFPKKKIEDVPAGNSKHFILASVITLIMAASMIYVYYIRDVQPIYEFIPINDKWVVVSMILTLGYIFIGSSTILNFKILFELRAIWRQIEWKRILVIGAFFVFVRLIQYLASDPVADHTMAGLSILPRLMYTVRDSIARPFMFFISHVAYFGPIILILLMLWKKVCRELSRHGLGLIIFFFLHLMLGICLESRQLILAFPFFVVIVVKVLDDHHWPKYNIWLLALLSLVVSKIWFPINIVSTIGDVHEIPLWRYFMNFGPWMNGEMYIYHSIGFVVLAGVFYFLLHRNNLIFGRRA